MLPPLTTMPIAPSSYPRAAQLLAFAATMLLCAHPTGAAAAPEAAPAPEATSDPAPAPTTDPTQASDPTPAPATVPAAPADPPVAKPKDDNTERVALVVSVDLGQDDTEIQDTVRERTISGLEDAGIRVEEDAEATLVVDVRWVKGTTTDYAVTFRLARDASTRLERFNFFLCEGCAGTQLLAKLQLEIMKVVPPELDKKPAPKKPAVAIVQPKAPPAAKDSGAKRRRRRGPNHPAMFDAGVFILPTGAGLLGAAGVGLIFLKAYDLRVDPWIWAMGGVGAGLTAVGIPLVAIPVWHARKQEARARLSLGPRGLVLSGRF